MTNPTPHHNPHIAPADRLRWANFTDHGRPVLYLVDASNNVIHQTLVYPNEQDEDAIERMRALQRLMEEPPDGPDDPRILPFRR